MKSALLLRTNLLLCALLAAGFAAVSFVNYSSTTERFRTDIEHVSELTTENIFHQINSYVTRPVSVSMTMANDSLLKRLLAEEANRMDDAEYLGQIQEYLNAYKAKYGYDSVFLVSTRTHRYYRFSGLDRVLARDHPENGWYYDFLESPDEYTLDVDNDESQAADRAVTTFVNCKIHNGDGRVLGVVGVGLRIVNLHQLLQDHRETYGIRTMLVDDTGTAAISSEDGSGGLTEGSFGNFRYVNAGNLGDVLKETDALAGEERKTFWVEGRSGDCFVALRHVPTIQWRLLAESDASAVTARFMRQLFSGMAVTALIALTVLVVVNKVVMAYNDQLLKRVVAREMEYNALVRQAASEMYKDVRDEKERATRLIEASRTDPLTGLCNRRAMETLLGGILRRLSRSRGMLSVLMIDVDFFKKYNDANGHSQGDECLRAVAGALRAGLKREGDFAARYGGEEFIVILPDTDAAGARRVAETLLQNVRDRALPHKNSAVACHVTLSIGGVTGRVERGQDMEDYIKRADEALYASKANGRNRYTEASLDL